MGDVTHGRMGGDMISQSTDASALRGYNLVWRLMRPALGLILRYRASKGKEEAKRIKERFGHYGETNISPGAIWLHAVSVGESVAALALVDALAKQKPDQHFLITTNTVTAAKLIARAATTATIQHLYQPLDHPAFVDRFLAQVKPAAAIFLESDFWPNLITRTKARGVPVVFASTQLSDKATSRWHQRALIARAMFGAADLVLPVNDDQASRLTELGVDKARITTIGSLKMSPSAMPVDPDLRDQLGRAIAGRKILLAASTHEGEDGIILDAAQQLGPEWLVIIAPRHPERGNAIASLCLDYGFKTAQRSKNALPDKGDRIFLMDSLGEMGVLFNLCDIVFLAGSLLPIGGHNPLEPASFGKPVISGPHVFKNSAEFENMRAQGLIFDAKNADEIASIAQALHDDGATDALAQKAKAYVKQAEKRQDQAAAGILSLIRTGQAGT